MLKRLAFTIVLLTVFIIPSQAFAAASWNQVVDEISGILDEALIFYEQGNVTEGKNKVNDAYFGPFEGDEMEKAVRINISAKRAFELEDRFSEIKKLMDKGAPSSEIVAVMNELNEMLRQDAAVLTRSEGGLLGVFLYSLSIILREGFEAILLIGALIGYLLKSGNEDKVKVIYSSAITAIIASLATALSIKYFFEISGQSQEALEGITMLVAVVVLFWVSYWLVSKVQGDRWQRYIQKKVHDSLSRGSTIALWAAAFLAVYREGAETVLFYSALMAGAEPGEYGMIGFGILIGAILLFGLFYAVRYTSIHLPIKPLFLGTGALMYLLAFIFAGGGIVELQAAGWISETSLNGFPIIGWLGIYPTWESLSLQAILLLAAIIPLLWMMVRKKVNRGYQS
ncbi:FTR1 family iron permease [Microaerobacter geothermalis]|uniref:FTR1 family iron permease n=1 Tax=Microaerobacter geothermalis TaxID=674972 RepID=UPI001F2B6100|nr:FTR1 family protein [Microaerobacter geothermalis]MCF6094399.1 FTR1 family iron permease [Microaerobacter geothermalis]